MKQILKLFIVSALLILCTFTAVSCSQWDTPYQSLDADGYNVSVKFDANGGVFAGTKDVTVIDVFSLKNQNSGASGMKEISLITPDDPSRKDRAFEVSKTDYFLAGWYKEKTPRVGENGEPLDDFGVPTSSSGRPQGYVYSGKWDFEKDKLEIDPSKSYTSSESVLTLYAAWVPYFNFEFYAQNSDKSAFELIDTYQMISVNVPEWNKDTGRIDMFKFPEIEGKTFDSAYLSEDMTEAVTGVISGSVDYEKGITTTSTVKIYTKWLDGDWYKIYTAKQFYDNSRVAGNYIICADLDFSSTTWSPTLTKGTFTGTIIGNGFKLSNIKSIQADNTQMNSGLFGGISSKAVISDVEFENVTYTVEAGSRMQGASIGMLAGNIESGATFENFKISGTILISDKIPPSDYNMGLLCGNCDNTDGITCDIQCKLVDEASSTIGIDVDTATGRVTLTFND